MKSFSIILLTAAVFSLSAESALVWGNSGAITNERGAAVASSKTDHETGSFAQLIWAGPDQTADPFVRSDTGTGGDDVVVATVFSAENFFDAPVPGIFPMRTLDLSTEDSSKVYFVRVFNAPNPDYAEGAGAPVPLRATYFWQSAMHTYEHNELLDDQWNFAPAGGRTLECGMIASNNVPVWWLVQHNLTNDYDTAAVGDQDGDLFPTDREWIADTDPTDSNSLFRITGIECGPPLTVYFESSADRIYTLLSTTDLQSNNWANVPGAASRAGAGGMDFMQDTNGLPRGACYRLNVQLP